VHNVDVGGPCMHRQCNGPLCSSQVHCCDLHSFTVCHDCWASDTVSLGVLLDVYRNALDDGGVDVHPHWRGAHEQEVTLTL
jgi:hypothetical protein